MHRSPCTRSHRRRTRVGAARGLRSRTLEDGAASLDAACSSFGCQIDRSRPSLWHHNPPHWRLGYWCVGRRLNRFRNGSNFHHCGRGFNGGSRHRRCIARLPRSCDARCNRGCSADGRRCRYGNRRGNRLCTLGSCCNISRGRNHRRTVRRGVCLGRGYRWLRGRRRLPRCCMGRGRGSNNHRRTRNDRSHGRLTHNRRRRCRRSHNLGVLPRLRHYSPWCGDRRGRCRRSARRRHRLGFRGSLGYHSWRCWNRRCRWTARCLARLLGCQLALKDQPRCVARLRYVRQIECRLGLHRRLAHRAAAAALSAEIRAHLVGLIGLDRTGVRLRLGDANRRQSIQDGLALDFQLPCKIVDSNFAHPSLFVSSAAFNSSYQPHRRWNLIQVYYP